MSFAGTAESVWTSATPASTLDRGVGRGVARVTQNSRVIPCLGGSQLGQAHGEPVGSGRLLTAEASIQVDDPKDEVRVDEEGTRDVAGASRLDDLFPFPSADLIAPC